MKKKPSLTFALDRSSDTPLFEQICQAVREMANSDGLKKGQILPATRELSADLGVSRSTVIAAYDQLVAEGYLLGKRGAGYEVCSVAGLEMNKLQRPKSVDTQPAESGRPLPFEPSQPDMRIFPYRSWVKTLSRVGRTNPQSLLVGGSAFGNHSLRCAIADHVLNWRGISVSPEQVIVTSGAMGALEACLRTLSKTGDDVGVEDPGYVPLVRYIQAMGLRPHFLRVDDEGAELPKGTSQPKLTILTPSHQYPLGGTMSPQRRLEYIKWADQNNTWIVEDDYDSEFRFAGRPIPAMAGTDRLKRTIYIGTFSKLFSNAFRLGYAVVPESLVEQFHNCIDTFSMKAGIMPQQILAEFFESGEFYKYLRRARRIYAERRDFLLHRLGSDFADLGTFKDNQAGMQIVFHLRADLKDTTISELAAKEGVALHPLSASLSGEGQLNGLILGYCAHTRQEMEAALRVLRSCFKKAQRAN